MLWRHKEATTLIYLRPSIGELTIPNSQSKHSLRKKSQIFKQGIEVIAIPMLFSQKSEDFRQNETDYCGYLGNITRRHNVLT